MDSLGFPVARARRTFVPEIPKEPIYGIGNNVNQSKSGSYFISYCYSQVIMLYVLGQML
jgi:hypothetical protein